MAVGCKLITVRQSKMEIPGNLSEELFFMRKLLLILAVALLASTAVQGQVGMPDSVFGGYSTFNSGNDLVVNGVNNFYNFDSGWFRNDGLHTGGNTNYLAGYCAVDDCGGYYFHDFFSFDLDNIDDYTVTSASFTLDTYAIKYDPGTFLLYGTKLSPDDVDSSEYWSNVGKYNALISGPLVGSIAVGPGDSYTNVKVTFNADGLAWLNSNAGEEVVLGGDFSEAGQVPEPGSLMLLLLGTGVIGLAGAIRRVRG
jgi:PEP-CTERM motif